MPKHRPKPKTSKFRHNPPRVGLFVSVSTEGQAGEKKASLQDQIDTLTHAVESRGWVVHDTIIVPGFSRSFFTYREFCDAAAQQNITDPQRMWKYWQDGENGVGEIDIVACVNASRIGREQSIVDEFVGRTYNAGYFMYTIKNGLVEPTQRRTVFMIEGYGAAGEIEELRRRNIAGMKKRVESGLPHVKPPYSHKYLRDDDGAVIQVVVDPAKRPFLDAARDLLLSGLPFASFPRAMAELGFLHNGKYFSRDYFRRFFYDSEVWGNTCIRDPELARYHMKRYGPYCFDPSIPPPPGISIQYNTHAAAWTGEEAQAIQEHLLAMRMKNTGRARSNKRYRFSLLLVCNDCHRAFRIEAHQRKRPFWICPNGAHRENRERGICNNSKIIYNDHVQAWFEDFLHNCAEVSDIDAYFASFTPDREDYAAALAATERELESAHVRAQLFITRQGEEPDMAYLYDNQLRQTHEQIRALETRKALLRTRALEHRVPDRKLIQAELREKLDTFWQQSDLEINTFLTRLMADIRFVVQNGRIIGFIPISRYKSMT